MRYQDLFEARGRRYIRFGDIPEGERSGVYAQAHMLSRKFTPGDMEKGVSVFDAQWNEDRQRWMIVDVGNFSSLDGLLGQRRPAFLVTGRRVGIGMDEETLLRNVKIIEPLPYDKMWVAAYGNDGGCEEYLVDYD
jgi:hypothetical protein